MTDFGGFAVTDFVSGGFAVTWKLPGDRLWRLRGDRLGGFAVTDLEASR